MTMMTPPPLDVRFFQHLPPLIHLVVDSLLRDGSYFRIGDLALSSAARMSSRVGRAGLYLPRESGQIGMPIDPLLVSTGEPFLIEAWPFLMDLSSDLYASVFAAARGRGDSGSTSGVHGGTPADGRMKLLSLLRIASSLLNLAPENHQLEDPPTFKYRWSIENFSRSNTKKLYSDIFFVGGYKWRVLIFPKGNNVDHLSIYLDVADSATLPYGWNRYAQFALAVVNQIHGKYTIRKDTQHQFNGRESDWGFTSFMSLSELYDPSRGYLVNDSCVIEAEVTVRKVVDYWSYDSKKETGYVGLKNQGATCYMNSLLQTLYHIPYFRKAVYHMPTTENDMPSGSIPLALQSLFYKLQYSDNSVATKELTKSFGWDTYDSFMQHDVQELNRVLCEKLEDKMKGTVVEGTIQHLFEGHHMNYIECINVDYKSTRKESFYDLQLDVKGCRDVYASFDKYVEVERLDGDNKYQAENHGLQDAKKGVLFIDFPPVLQLQLKRFEYDFMRDTMVKINDRYEFPLQLDLDRDNGRYLSPDADRRVCNLYTLHSILVHSGGVHGGHYYAFIRPTLSDQWYLTLYLYLIEYTLLLDASHQATFSETAMATAVPVAVVAEGGELPPKAPPQAKAVQLMPASYLGGSLDYHLEHWVYKFDDERVTKEDAKRALEEQYGGEEETNPGFNNTPFKFTKYSNAYMLVYIRESDKEKIMCNADEKDIAEHLRVARNEDLTEQIGREIFFDLVDHDKVRSFRIQKQLPFNHFKEEVAIEFGIPVQFQRFWLWAKRQNHTYRPNRPLLPQEEAQSVNIAPMDLLLSILVFWIGMGFVGLSHVGELREVSNKAHNAELKLFLEVELGPDLHPLPPPLKTKEDILLFFKLYDPEKKDLRFVGRLFVKALGKPIDILSKLIEMAEFSANEEIELYEEIKFESNVMCERIDKKISFKSSQLEDGDIICYQRALTSANRDEFQYPDVPSFLEYVRNRQLVFSKLQVLCQLVQPPTFTMEWSNAKGKNIFEILPWLAARQILFKTMAEVQGGMFSRGNFVMGRIKLEMHPADSLLLTNFVNLKIKGVVHFRSLEKPKEEDFSLELSKLFAYDDVVERVARHLGLDDPTKIRLTSHNCYSQQPKPQPIKYRGVDHLSDMLVHYNQTSDILYYEILDIPLPELQGLKTLKVAFHHATKEEVAIHSIRLPKNSTVADVINDLKTKVELSRPDTELRLLEVFYHKIYKPDVNSATSISKTEDLLIFPPGEKIENINDQYWTLCAEEQVQNFGEPFFLVIKEGETLANVKIRIQKKLQVPDDEFSKWKFAFISLGRPEYLQDSDVVSNRFQRRDIYGAWEQFLGLEHSDTAPKRAYTTNQLANSWIGENDLHILKINAEKVR
ncbi:hypothetical protein ZIOFF_057501 [Zingiber officinale]|uniref:ubiquitinyl hydrolase 1 n=1 Tax=Zingiber officinale TaxID=94328 RepID=A0A8J5F7P1_ZINOF|nr:hypothetical protein ZIOFF_057501 [Zingiber officinale]